MTKVFDDSALNIEGLPNGFIIAFKKADNDEDERIVVAYNLVSFENQSVSPVTRNVYQLAKFGGGYKEIEQRLNNPFYWNTVNLPGDRLLAFYPSGEYMIFDTESRMLKKGELLCDGEGPSGMALTGVGIFASFKEGKRVSLYNPETFIEELYIGGKGSGFGKIESVFSEGNFLYLSDSEKGVVWRVDIRNFNVTQYAEFGEPVYQYMIIGDYTLVRLDSGVYSL